MSLRSPIPAVAAAVAVAPAIIWVWSAGEAASGFRGIGIFAGFAAAGLLAASMVLMLRSTRLDRVFGGLGNAYQAHRPAPDDN